MPYVNRTATSTVVVAQTIREVTETASGITVNKTTDEVSIAVEQFFASLNAATLAVTPYNSMTSTNIQEAVEELADQHFVQGSAPSGSNLEEGDLWYNTITDNLYVYRETSPSTFEWIPIASATGDMDTLDSETFV
jgi:hypothetical protein